MRLAFICCGVLLSLGLLVSVPAQAATTAPAVPAVTAPALPVDAFVLDSPFDSAIPTACRWCIARIEECPDADGTPCGKDAGKDPSDPTIVCRCGFCQGQIGCKKNV